MIILIMIIMIMIMIMIMIITSKTTFLLLDYHIVIVLGNPQKNMFRIIGLSYF